MTEQWKTIKGTDGYYSVSNKGRVRRNQKHIITSNGITRLIKERILKPAMINGYESVSMSVKDKETKELVHRLVGKHFIENPKGKNQINHKDLNRSNNNVTNLEWCTHHENMSHAAENWRMKIGSDQHASKLNELDVLFIREMLADGYKQKELGEMYGVRQTTISLIKLNKGWKHV